MQNCHITEKVKNNAIVVLTTFAKIELISALNTILHARKNNENTGLIDALASNHN